MLRYPKKRISLTLALIVGLLISLAATTAVFAQSNSARGATPTISAKKSTSPRILYSHTVDMSKVPQATPAQLKKTARSMPRFTSKHAAAAQTAKSNAAAPHNAGYPSLGGTTTNATGPLLPSTYNKFAALSDSASTCPYFGGCQPPDMGLAASPAGLALQSVNSSLALYNNGGTLQSGWPKTAQAFFGVPNPTPAGCDTSGPFLSDPRGWFDPYNNRWGEAIMQLENAAGIGAGCDFKSIYWIATSTSSNPNGTWRVFALNMVVAGGDTTGWADFTQFGFNADGIYVSANIINNAGTAYDYAEIFGCPKSAIYGGVSFACNGWYDLSLTVSSSTVLLDTLNPVQTPMSADNSPHTEFFTSAFNIMGDPFGNDCFSTACHGLAVFSWSDPANTTGSGNKLSGTFVDTQSYIAPPKAHQPSCAGSAAQAACVDAGDTRIGATPVYHAGHIFAAHGTGITNASSQFVPGIQWWDITPALAVGYPTTLTGATVAQDAYLNAKDSYTALSYPVIYPNLDNDLIMGFDYMGDTIYPSVNFTSRRVTDPLNKMTGGLGIIAVHGTVSTPDSRWGDYNAMSYTAPYQDFIWFGAEYANPNIGGDWGTYLMKFKINLNG